MTTLAIIGSGILGRSLIYTLAKEQKQFEKITLFSSDKITIPCTLNSTAIAAARGTSTGMSELGDLLVEGYSLLKDHISLDRPMGVQKIFQYSAATLKLDQFRTRHPDAAISTKFLKHEAYMAQEEAFMFDPETYCDWLLDEARAMEQYHLEILNDLVLEITEGERIHLKTLNGRNLSFDKVVFACGSYNRFWKPLAPETKLKSSKPSQGSYFEFNDVSWDEDSFSLTLDGDNLIWNKPFKRLYVGSTTSDNTHYLPPMHDLSAIYERLKEKTVFNLPDMSEAIIKIGLREKAQKREPYLVNKENVYFVGGLYKNAFSLSLKMSRSLSHQLL